MGAYLVHRRSWRVVRHGTVALAALMLGSVTAAAQAARISGRITDAGSGMPVSAARVFVAGTAAATQSGDDGRYTLRGVSTGTIEVTVTRLGYEAKKTSVAVSGEVTTLDIALSQVTYSLAEVVTTVTGQQRKVELGNTIPTISVGE